LQIMEKHYAAVIISQPPPLWFAKIWKFEILAWKCSKFFETYKTYHKIFEFIYRRCFVIWIWKGLHLKS
jgi:hypothetical protein